MFLILISRGKSHLGVCMPSVLATVLTSDLKTCLAQKTKLRSTQNSTYICKYTYIYIYMMIIVNIKMWGYKGVKIMIF